MEKTYYTLINTGTEHGEMRLYCSPHFYEDSPAGKMKAEAWEGDAIKKGMLKLVRVQVKVIEND